MARPPIYVKTVVKLKDKYTPKEIIEITGLASSTVYKILSTYGKLCRNCRTPLINKKCLKCKAERKRRNIENGYSKKRSDKNKTIFKVVVNHFSNETNKCACCGESNILFLTISHKNNDGYLHKKELGGGSYYQKLFHSNFKTDREIIIECYNCNMSRTRTGGECAHKSYI